MFFSACNSRPIFLVNTSSIYYWTWLAEKLPEILFEDYFVWLWHDSCRRGGLSDNDSVKDEFSEFFCYNYNIILYVGVLILFRAFYGKLLSLKRSMGALFTPKVVFIFLVFSDWIDFSAPKFFRYVSVVISSAPFVKFKRHAAL